MTIEPSLHILMIAMTILMPIVAVRLGSGRSEEGRRRMSGIFGGAMLAICIFYNGYYFHPAIFSWDKSLPLQMCDVLGILSAAVMLCPFLPGRAFLYASALPLAAQAILTPTGDQSPDGLHFWTYWLLHIGIFLCSAFDVFVNRFRPRPCHIRAVVALDALYLTVVLSLNFLFGFNYGYLGDAKPGSPTAVDFLGPWPGRIATMVLIVIALQCLMLVLPSVIARARRASCTN